MRKMFLLLCLLVLIMPCSKSEEGPLTMGDEEIEISETEPDNGGNRDE
jgi:hypothetical protein